MGASPRFGAIGKKHQFKRVPAGYKKYGTTGLSEQEGMPGGLTISGFQGEMGEDHNVEVGTGGPRIRRSKGYGGKGGSLGI